MQIEFTSVFEPGRALPDRDSGFPVSALLRHAAQVEDAELDRLAISSHGPQFEKAAFLVLENAPALGALLTHRAGQLSPQSAAEQFGLFDQLSRGRLTLRIEPPSGAAFAEKHNAHELAHEALDEYLVLLRRFWSSADPIDYQGRHYRVSNAHVAAKPFSRSGVPLILGGRSGTAIQIAARHADIFWLDAAPIGELRRHIARFRTAAIAYHRAESAGIALPVRTIIGDTRNQAWTAARSVETPDAGPPAEQRLVGTADQVALQFLALIDVGVTHFAVHGLQDETQMTAFARDVLPLVRASASRREPHRLQDLISDSGSFGFYPSGRPLIS